MQTIFFGSSKFVLPILEVVKKNYDLSLILTTEHNPHGPVSSFAKEHTIQFIDVEKFTPEILDALKRVPTEFAVLAYFGMILPQHVLDIFPKGIINVHPSLLPLYRGPTPGQAAILAGDTKTGVTIIKLDEAVDHGPMLGQETAEIQPNDTAETLYTRLFTIGAQLCSDVLIRHYKGEMVATPQDHTKATFTDHMSRESGFFESSKPPTTEKLDRMIRAYFPWPGVWTKININNKEVRIKILPEHKLQVEGKKPMSYKDFVNGYPDLKEFVRKLEN